MSELAEKLSKALSSKVKDNSEYGKLPTYEDILLIKSEQPIRKQWDKLNLIRKNLLILNRFLKNNKRESLNAFLKNSNELGMSKMVLDKIGNKTDETGGIKAYFLSLQKLYDSEEMKYDEMEIKSKIDDSIDSAVRSSRESRMDKREIRRKIGKDRMKKLKDSGKGFFKQEEPQDLTKAVVPANYLDKNADGSDNKKETPEEKINRARKIVVSLAGVGIVIGVGFAIHSAFKS